ncbi:MAG TPA: OmpA family protein [Kofleriaceae bacterium]|nr:OmpA family protein [Kofleriaceae bacterium]
MGMTRLCWVAVVLCSLATSARADNGLDAERFVPAIGAEGGFHQEHPAVPFHLGWSLGLFLNFADDPVVEKADNGDVLSRPVDTALTMDLTASLGLFGWMELGIGLPVHLIYDGDPYATGGTTLDASGGVGDLRFVPKFALLRRGSVDNHVLLGFAIPVSLPTGDDEAWRGAGGVTVEPRLMLAYHAGRLGLGMNLGYRWRAEDPPTLPWGDEITLGPWLKLGLTDALALRVEAIAGKQVGTDVDGADFPMEALGGLEIAAGENLLLYAGGSLGITDGIGDPNVRIIGGLRFRHNHPQDQGFRDSDGDRIADKDDAAPYEPEDEDGYQDDDGAPEPDNDGDGIRDEDDECPELSGDKAHDGCPAKTFVKIVEGKIYIFGKVQFRSGSAEIDARSEPLLDQIAEALEANPQVKHVRVEGHTDNVGDPGFNMRLSQQRAESVKKALEKRGVAGDRLEPKGYGETHPIAPNKSGGGRRQNRRVEFIIVGR